jgi:hypothetical protein
VNCAQCRTVNGPAAGYCSNCGAPLGGPVAGQPGPEPGPGGPAEAGFGGPAGAGFGGPAAGYGGPSGPGYQQPGPYQQPGQYQPGKAGPLFRSGSRLPSASWDFSRLTSVDKIVAGATLVTMISIWLPWFSGRYTALGQTSTGSVSGTGDHGWLWLEFILALVLLGYLASRAAWDRPPFRLPVAHETALIAATGLQFLLIVIGFLAMPSSDGIAGFSVSWDFGAFLALIASIVAAAPVA